ncbi:E3 SUMO-protein ligase ZBED1 [Frankliniella fusca]|uniref:E3 SUMO-protein ligase ZBED1 n=1 Tax=Frankliniella fusca TaxID=407009 RepID=A0AAE1HLG2_9NEOP|nr:E3 SUMO-protein ligase ZBED1 [Frankliniella fusca]
MRTHLKSAHQIDLPKLNPKRKSAQLQSFNSNLDADEESVDDPPEVSCEGSNSDLSAGDAQATAHQTRPGARRSPGDTLARCVHGVSTPQRDHFLIITFFLVLLSEGGARHREVTDALLFMMAHDDMPLRTPERTGFRVFCKKINPKYKIPSEPTTTKKMHEKHASLRARVKKELGETNGINLTMDIWTSIHKMDSFLGVTAHYLKGVYLKSVELTARPLHGSKTAENLQGVIRIICGEWNIDIERVSAVVTDGGGNIKNAVKEIFGATKHISCFGHILNLIGTKAIGLHKRATRPSEAADGVIEPDLPEHESDLDEDDAEVIVEAVGRQAEPGAGANQASDCLSDILKKVKKIVTFYRQSEVATAELNQCQIDANKKENQVLKLIQECRTRWNSAFEMVDRFLHLSDYVTLTLMKLQREKRTKAKPPNMLTNDEIGILREARYLLRPLAQATVEASADQHVTISKIIPLVNLMKEKIESYLPESGIAYNLKEQLLNDIRSNFGHLEYAKPFAAATLLDPRFKKLPFKNENALRGAIAYVGGLMKAKMAVAEEETNAMDVEPLVSAHDLEGEGEEENDLWTSLDRNVQVARAARRAQPSQPGIPDELLRYLAQPNVDRKKCPNPIECLESTKDSFPMVHAVARDVLPVLATSTPCERLFSHAGLIYTQRRGRLLSKRLDELIFLRSVDEETWFACPPA